MANKDYLQDLTDAQQSLSSALKKLYSNRSENRRMIVSVGTALRQVSNAFMEHKRLGNKKREQQRLEQEDLKKQQTKQYWQEQAERNILRRDDNG